MLTQVELLLINLETNMCKNVKAIDVKITITCWKRSSKAPIIGKVEQTKEKYNQALNVL